MFLLLLRVTVRWLFSAIDTFVGARSPTVVMSLKFTTVKHSQLLADADTHFGNDLLLQSCQFWCTLAHYETLLYYCILVICWIWLQTSSSMAAGFGQHGMPPPICNLDLWPFDLETGVRVASKVGNLHSEFGHARPLGSQIIRSVCYRWADKSNACCPLPYSQRIITLSLLHLLKVIVMCGIDGFWKKTRILFAWFDLFLKNAVWFRYYSYLLLM